MHNLIGSYTVDKKRIIGRKTSDIIHFDNNTTYIDYIVDEDKRCYFYVTIVYSENKWKQKRIRLV